MKQNQPKTADEKINRSTSRLSTRPASQDLFSHLSEVKRSAALIVNAEIVAQSTSKWSKQHVEQGTADLSATLSHGI